jgi:hypothetical protein
MIDSLIDPFCAAIYRIVIFSLVAAPLLYGAAWVFNQVLKYASRFFPQLGKIGTLWGLGLVVTVLMVIAGMFFGATCLPNGSMARHWTR